MAGRIRYFRPELLDDEVMASLSSDAWRIVVSLVLLADDFGNVRFSDKYVGANVYQDTGRDVRAASDELVRAGIVTTYSVEGQQYAAIRGWTEDGRFRQRLDNASKRSRVPGPERDDRTNVRVLGAEPAETRGDSVHPPEGTRQTRGSRARAPIPIPTSDPDHRPPTTGTDAAAETAAGAIAPPAPALELKLEEPKAKKLGTLERIFGAYKDARKRFNPKTKVDQLVLSEKAKKAIAARLREGHKPNTLVLAAIGIFRDPWEGRVNHIDLDVAMRSENVTKFAELAEEDPTVKWARLPPRDDDPYANQPEWMPRPTVGTPEPPRIPMTPEQRAEGLRKLAEIEAGRFGGKFIGDAAPPRGWAPLGPPTPPKSYPDDARSSAPATPEEVAKIMGPVLQRQAERDREAAGRPLFAGGRNPLADALDSIMAAAGADEATTSATDDEQPAPAAAFDAFWKSVDEIQEATNTMAGVRKAVGE